MKELILLRRRRVTRHFFADCWDTFAFETPLDPIILHKAEAGPLKATEQGISRSVPAQILHVLGWPDAELAEMNGSDILIRIMEQLDLPYGWAKLLEMTHPGAYRQEMWGNPEFALGYPQGIIGGMAGFVIGFWRRLDKLTVDEWLHVAEVWPDIKKPHSRLYDETGKNDLKTWAAEQVTDAAAQDLLERLLAGSQSPELKALLEKQSHKGISYLAMWAGAMVGDICAHSIRDDTPYLVEQIFGWQLSDLRTSEHEWQSLRTADEQAAEDRRQLESRQAELLYRQEQLAKEQAKVADELAALKPVE